MIPLRDNIASRSFPFVNYALIAANLICFFYQLSLGTHLDHFIYTWGMVPAFFFLAFWVILQFISGAAASAAGSASGGVAWGAHIGGFASGIVQLFVFKKRK